MKIAIVCGHFLPEMGYVEVYFAKELTKAQHQVMVITTNKIPSYVKKIEAKKFLVGQEKNTEYGYAIFRMAPFFSLGQMVVARGLKKTLLQFSPGLVVVVGVGKLFPYPIYKLNSAFRIVTLLGDNSESFENETLRKRVKNKLIKLLKRPVYTKAIQHSEKLFPYTPETIHLVKQLVSKNQFDALEKKSTSISLGFDDDVFYFDANERAAKQKELNLFHQTIMITATRIVPYKRLEQMIDVVDLLNTKGINLHYVIVGFFEDAYSQKVKKYIQQKKYAHQFTCLPFLPNNEVRQLYASADIAYFPTAVISIFEAMGTGLVMVLPSKNNVSHILDGTRNGFYIKDETLEETVQKAIQHLTQPGFNRQALIEQNSNLFAWKNIVKKVVNSIT